MTLRAYATFSSSLPDDQQEEDDHIVSPGGRNIMIRLREGLVKRGFTVSEPENNEDYGWAFFVSFPGCSVWCLLQFAEPWLLITELMGGIVKRLFGRLDTAPHERVCATLHEVIVSDPTFSGLLWFSRREYEQSKGRVGHERPEE